MQFKVNKLEDNTTEYVSENHVSMIEKGEESFSATVLKLEGSDEDCFVCSKDFDSEKEALDFLNDYVNELETCRISQIISYVKNELESGKKSK